MKTVVITGADRGLGLALCREFLEKAYRVYAGQFMPEWPELNQLLQQYPETLRLVPLDVGDPESVARAAETIGRETDVVDILINNAGVTARGEGTLWEEMDLSKSLNAFRVNCVGTMQMVHHLLPLMQTGERRLCFISSEAGSIGVCARESFSGYCMSKAALNMGIRLLFNRLQPQGYRFRLYHPGWMRTYMSGKKTDIGKIEAEESAQVAVAQFLEDRNWEDRLVMLDCYGQAWPF